MSLKKGAHIGLHMYVGWLTIDILGITHLYAISCEPFALQTSKTVHRGLEFCGLIQKTDRDKYIKNNICLMQVIRVM